jgi:osmotically-inducible protein OsmY
VKVASVDKGVVLLSGKADGLGHELQAIEVAYKVPGLRRVASEIETRDKGDR